MATREPGEVYGEVAGGYHRVRPGYPAALVAAVRAYAGRRRPPGTMVEVGAGTGLATVDFARWGVPIRCLEPDPRMAAVLRGRLAGHPQVAVTVGRFEDWRPPAGGVDLLYSAQAWHWVDGTRRWRLAREALAPGGTVAVFGHSYDVVDPALEAELWDLHHRLDPATSTMAPPGTVDPDRAWFTVELARCGLFTEVRAEKFPTVVAYPTDRYLRLIRTFSAFRTLPPERQREMSRAVAALVDAYGGAIEIDLATILALGRRS